MKNWLKRIFCKHKYDLIEGQIKEPARMVEMENQNVCKLKTKIGVYCFCMKCGKENKRLGRSIAQIRANQIEKEQINNIDKILSEVLKNEE